MASLWPSSQTDRSGAPRSRLSPNGNLACGKLLWQREKNSTEGYQDITTCIQRWEGLKRDRFPLSVLASPRLLVVKLASNQQHPSRGRSFNAKPTDQWAVEWGGFLGFRCPVPAVGSRCSTGAAVVVAGFSKGCIVGGRTAHCKLRRGPLAPWMDAPPVPRGWV